MSKTVSRRTFIKGAAVVGLALTAGGCLPWNGNNVPEKVQKGEVTYDVLVIGSGGAWRVAIHFCHLDEALALRLDRYSRRARLRCEHCGGLLGEDP